MTGPSLLIVGERRTGRPTIYGTRASERMAFRLTDDQKRDLREIAKAEDRDMTMIVRDAVDEYVADYRERKLFTKPNRYQPE
jgi:hypothetical protein